MFKFQKYILTTTIILSMVISVFVCAYSSMMSMDSMGMHVDTNPTEHIEHAQSLTLATIPELILLLISLLVIALQYGFEKSNNTLTVLYNIADSYFSKTRLRYYYLFNPRSPPAY